MKNKKFQSIVMPCTKEQYESLIPVLKENKIEFESLINLNPNCEYIVNDLRHTPNLVGFIAQLNISRKLYSKIYKRFNRKIFLASVGIVEEPEFVLPEKWCVRITKENAYILNEYLIRHLHKYKHSHKSWHIDTNIEINDCLYFYSETYETTYGNYGHSSNLKYSTFTEITFEQFQKYVLKQDMSILESQSVTNKQTKMKSRIQKKNPPAHVYQKGDLINFGNDVVAIATKTVSHDFNATVLFSRNDRFKPGDIIHTTQGSDKLSVFIGEVILEQ